MIERSSRHARAARHAALGDPVRLAIVDELVASDRSPVELRRLLGIESNLLAHHLQVLDEVGLVVRSRSSGDGRRRYVHLRVDAFDGLVPGIGAGATDGLAAGAASTDPTLVGPALFVCTANSARSQLAASLWRHRTAQPAASAGTRPAARVHRGAVAAARRAGVDLDRTTRPTLLDRGRALPPLVVTVCDRAHEQLEHDRDAAVADAGEGARGDARTRWLHWSVPDPVAEGTAAAFDAVVRELDARIARLVAVGA